MDDNLAWALVIGAGFGNAGMALAGKAAEHHQCRSTPYALMAMAVAAVAVLATTLRSPGAWGDWRLWTFGATMGVMIFGALVTMVHANRFCQPSIVWGVANMGFVLPIALSAVCLGEGLRWLDLPILAGVALMVAGLIERTPPGPGTVTSARRWLLLGVIFATNGLVMFGFKVVRAALPGQTPAAPMAVMYACGAVLAVAFQSRRGGLRLRRTELGWGGAAGLLMSCTALALLGAMKLPAAAAFPVIQGMSLVGGVLLCALVFRERLTVRKLLGLAVGVGAMVLTRWR